ncbi:hypothetical protein C8R41DRAFT_872327 [Lentinula lateritia]|uniref:Uncharacterized protein n=1 Tax=Lentinula lateritia TaxID=40482 RepID=A0ABQ8UWF8_9AGAR|nr:hypothetical protein C8R41DRAFT_872327 [Lentinula lateritia]
MTSQELGHIKMNKGCKILVLGEQVGSLWEVLGSVLGAGWSSKGATETTTEDRNDLVVDKTERFLGTGIKGGRPRVWEVVTAKRLGSNGGARGGVGETIVKTVDKNREKQR